MDSFLALNHVSYAYHSPQGELPAMTDLCLSIEKGEFVSIVGPSGCGKSTLLSLICGLLKPEEGSILVGGHPPDESDVKIGYMLQKDHLFEWRNIFKNVCLGQEIQKAQTPDSLAYTTQLLKSYGLEGFEDVRPSELSGGMRQRAALIRTMTLHPDLLLLDEPFSALDYQTRLEVCDDIAMIIKEAGKTAVLVTHDLSEAISFGNRVIVLSSRPARVKADIRLSFDEGLSPLKRRSDQQFYQYFNLIWEELKGHE